MDGGALPADGLDLGSYVAICPRGVVGDELVQDDRALYAPGIGDFPVCIDVCLLCLQVYGIAFGVGAGLDVCQSVGASDEGVESYLCEHVVELEGHALGSPSGVAVGSALDEWVGVLGAVCDEV